MQLGRLKFIAAFSISFFLVGFVFMAGTEVFLRSSDYDYIDIAAARYFRWAASQNLTEFVSYHDCKMVPVTMEDILSGALHRVECRSAYADKFPPQTYAITVIEVLRYDG